MHDRSTLRRQAIKDLRDAIRRTYLFSSNAERARIRALFATLPAGVIENASEATFFTVWIATWRYTRPNGKRLEGVGIVPSSPSEG